MNTMESSMLKIILNHVERIRAFVPHAHILLTHIGHQIPSPRIIHTGGQQFFLQQLFAIRLQLSHINVIAEMSLEYDRIVTLKIAQIPVTHQQCAVFVGSRCVYMDRGVLVKQLICVKNSITPLPFTAEADFRNRFIVV